MKFIRSNDWKSGIDALTGRLQRELLGGTRVLWLVPGGSNIAAAVAIMSNLEMATTDKLSILLTDERFGPKDHPDSNAHQLREAGFDPKQAHVIPVLTGDLPLEAALRHYDEVAQQAFREAELVIGQFGIGPDGHIAGILPDSIAVSSPDFVAGYEAPPYVRMTLTFHAIKRLAAAYAFVFGDNKLHALEQLQDETLPYNVQPSQILKELPEAYIFNDQIGDDV